MFWLQHSTHSLAGGARPALCWASGPTSVTPQARTVAPRVASRLPVSLSISLSVSRSLSLALFLSLSLSLSLSPSLSCDAPCDAPRSFSLSLPPRIRHGIHVLLAVHLQIKRIDKFSLSQSLSLSLCFSLFLSLCMSRHARFLGVTIATVTDTQIQGHGMEVGHVSQAPRGPLRCKCTRPPLEFRRAPASPCRLRGCPRSWLSELHHFRS